MPTIEPHPELHITISVSAAVEINLEKQLSCMITLPRCPATYISAKTEETPVIGTEEEMEFRTLRRSNWPPRADTVVK